MNCYLYFYGVLFVCDGGPIVCGDRILRLHTTNWLERESDESYRRSHSTKDQWHLDRKANNWLSSFSVFTFFWYLRTVLCHFTLTLYTHPWWHRQSIPRLYAYPIHYPHPAVRHKSALNPCSTRFECVAHSISSKWNHFDSHVFFSLSRSLFLSLALSRPAQRRRFIWFSEIQFFSRSSRSLAVCSAFNQRVLYTFDYVRFCAHCSHIVHTVHIDRPKKRFSPIQCLFSYELHVKVTLRANIFRSNRNEPNK